MALDPSSPGTVSPAPASTSRRDRPLKAFWRRIRKPLAESDRVKGLLGSLLAAWLRLVRATNPTVVGSVDVETAYDEHAPLIVALWHGQHLLAPTFYPRRMPLVAMVSRSADAELNAIVLEKFGFEAVRGSGGRENSRHLDKGGAKALVALKKALDAGKSVCMIADIPHGTPRDAGLGIVMLARFAGRPIIPVAIATSRRKVIEKSWDKTTINLPFGRSALVLGEPVRLAPRADDSEIEAARRLLTERMNEATARAYAMVDSRP